MRIIGIFASGVLRVIQDFFTRTTTTSLGTANTGQTWLNTRGTWFANGSAAQSNDAASTYPLSSIPFSQNVTVSAAVTEGTGVSFWVTDANNWYATVAYHTQASYSCNCSTCCNTCTHTGGSCGSTCNTCQHTGGSCGNTYSCANGTTPCNGNTVCYSNPGCTGTIVSGVTVTPITCTNQDCDACGSTPNTCTNSDCTACGSYSCNCQTCYSDFYYMRMLKSISGTISQVISDYAVASLPAAIKVVTSGDTITETAYSDTSLTTSLGSTSTTPSGPIKGTGVGIIKVPAAITQGSTVDIFNAN